MPTNATIRSADGTELKATLLSRAPILAAC